MFVDTLLALLTLPQLKETIWDSVEEPSIDSLLPTIIEGFKDIDKKRGVAALKNKNTTKAADEKGRLLPSPPLPPSLPFLLPSSDTSQ
jgi:hypothetical protein